MKRREFIGTLGVTAAVARIAQAFPLFPQLKTKTTDAGMKVHYEIKTLKLKHTWTISRNSGDVKNNVFVYLEKDGVTGIGEAAPNTRYDETPESTITLIKKATPLIEKLNPWEFAQFSLELQAIESGQTAGKCAIDLALMDWIGKSLNLPLYKFWGLDPNKAPLTSFTIGIDTAEIVKQKTREAEPFKILKIKVGGSNDEEMVTTVRSVAPDKPIRVDANEGWKDKEIAIRKIEWLAKNGVELVEQPMPAEMLEETRWIRDRIDIPIIADEAVKTASDIPKLAEVFDGINIKLMKAGGLQEALRMVWLAKSLGLKIMIGCMIESSVAISAAAQLCSLIDYADLDGNLLISNDPFSGVIFKDGRQFPADRPGLGVRKATG
ncbi:MAG TPA: dipeptide epimerase [Candidatus Marinimicrobia bacterium]|nr:dipeptide epimerase [Candidatus Neomarinimicrobiota bacterium]HRS51725.1 dipeptide epimerase [Candidatus Neomarinimicrobiota bacterium]HRU92125.1 dipeptide epimerase [Candidatus Neomarinimicrobiota bacterium]